MSYLPKTVARLVPLLALALLASIMSATAVSAAPKNIGGPDSDPDSEPHDPTGDTTPETTRPQNTEPRPQPADVGSQQRLVDSAIQVDSVSALATVTFEDAVAVTVRWGDGEEDTVDITSSKFVGRNPLGRNTVYLEHTYDDNDGDPYQLFATISVLHASGSSDPETLPVNIVPRYFVTETATEFQSLNHCDSTFEYNTEYEIRRTFSREPDFARTWNFSMFTKGTTPTKKLDSAAYYHEFTKEEGGTVRYKIDEKDPSSDDKYRSADDESMDYFVSPGMDTGRQEISLVVEKFPDTDCHAELRFTLGHGLVQPSLSPGPVATEPDPIDPF